MSRVLARVYGDRSTLDACIAVAIEHTPEAESDAGGRPAAVVVWRGPDVAAVVRPRGEGPHVEAVVFGAEGVEVRRYPVGG
jgi:hypothetical protein